MTSSDRSVRPFGPARQRALSSRMVFLALTAGLVACVGAGAALAARSDKWWWDYGGGPSGSQYVELDQIKKSNVSQLDVAWYYPYGTTVFNPIVVEDVIYGYGRSGSLIALDASTGKEIWIHEGLTGLNPRGVNYWQSPDGRDRRSSASTASCRASTPGPGSRFSRSERTASSISARGCGAAKPPCASSRTTRARSSAIC